MGLDDFKSDDESKPDKSEENNEKSEATTESTENVEEQNDASGLDAFRTDDTGTPDNDSSTSDDETEETHRQMYEKLGDVPTEKEVEYIRENHIDDYYPDYKREDGWSFASVIEVTCVCENTFTFRSKGLCINCGRSYKRTGRTVIQVNSPDEDSNNV